MKASISYREYRQDAGISPSDIKLFGRDVPAFYKAKILKETIEERKSKALAIGDVADMILTQPADIDKLYYILTEWKATEKVKEIVDFVFNKRTEQITLKEAEGYLDLGHFELMDILKEGIEEVGYYKNWTMNKRMETILDKGTSYYEQLQEAKGRDLIELKDYNKAVQAVERGRLNKDMQSFIWAIEGTEVPPDVTIKTQTAIYGYFNGVRIKGLVDVIWIDNKARTMQPIEIKTTRYLQQFLKIARMFRYDIQIDLYQYILEQVVYSDTTSYKGYQLLPPKFLVLPVEGEQQPEWFQLTTKDLYIARYGHDSGPGRHIYGWTESLADICWHKDNNKWEHHRSYYENMINTADLWSSSLDLIDETEIEDNDIFTIE